MPHLLICLLLLQTPAPQALATDGVITGRVLDAAGAPVPAAIVALLGEGGARDATQRVLTDQDGRYFFDRLAAGKYTLNATKPGWMSGAFGKKRIDGVQAIFELAEHERRPKVDITMWKYGVLSGTIVDEAGEPLVDIPVKAVRRMLASGKRQMTFVGTARTDDRGMYRIAGMVPGEYSVFVPATVTSGATTVSPGNAPEDWLRSMTGEGTAPMSLNFESGVAAKSGRTLVTSLTGVTDAPSPDTPWLAIPPSFAGTPLTAGAAMFTLTPGQEHGGIDMQLRRVPTYSISGMLSVLGGSPANIVLHLMSAGLADFPLFDVATATADGSGVFTFFGVPTGDYVIRVVRVPLAPGQRLAITSSGTTQSVRMLGGGPGSSPPAVPVEPLLHATEKVSVADASVKNVLVTLRPGPRITGRVEFDGSAKKPQTDAEWRAAGVWPERANGYQSTNPPTGQFVSDGTFSLPSLMPGDYYVRATAPAGWSVKSIAWQGHNLIDAPLALANTDVADVIVTFTDHAGTVGGTVYAANDVPDAAALVVFFPTTAEEWTDYGVVSPRMVGVRTQPDGTFRTRPMAEGDYFMIAIPDDQAAEWQDPATLAKLSKTAKRVTVRDGESSNENLKAERIK